MRAGAAREASEALGRVQGCLLPAGCPGVVVGSSKPPAAMGSRSAGAGPGRDSPGSDPRAGEGKEMEMEMETDPPGPRHRAPRLPEPP